MKRASTALSCAVAALLLAGLAWRAPRTPHAAAPPVAQATPTHAPASATAPAQPAAGVRPRMLASAPSDEAACIVKSPDALAQAAASSEPSANDVARPPEPRAQASRASLLARLRASPDPYANAVAVWLDIDSDADGDQHHAAERQRRLAAMAASTRDPRVYALALRSCWKKQAGECGSLSARRWSELEPDNALPWLMMLDEAAQHGDASGEQEAMFHATHSRWLAMREQAPLQPIVDSATDDADSLAAARAVSIDALGISASEVWPRSINACRGAARSDANAWQQCTAMIDLLEHRSDSLLARSIGASLDKRLTGNGRPMAALIAQRGRVEPTLLGMVSASGCADLRAKLTLMRRLAVEGEAVVALDLAR